MAEQTMMSPGWSSLIRRGRRRRGSAFRNARGDTQAGECVAWDCGVTDPAARSGHGGSVGSARRARRCRAAPRRQVGELRGPRTSFRATCPTVSMSSSSRSSSKNTFRSASTPCRRGGDRVREMGAWPRASPAPTVLNGLPALVEPAPEADPRRASAGSAFRRRVPQLGDHPPRRAAAARCCGACSSICRDLDHPSARAEDPAVGHDVPLVGPAMPVDGEQVVNRATNARTSASSDARNRPSRSSTPSSNIAETTGERRTWRESCHIRSAVPALSTPPIAEKTSMAASGRPS